LRLASVSTPSTGIGAEMKGNRGNRTERGIIKEEDSHYVIDKWGDAIIMAGFKSRVSISDPGPILRDVPTRNARPR
jgi:hypothetical protein